MHSNLAREFEISDNNGKKIRWKLNTVLLLNGWGENCQIF